MSSVRSVSPSLLRSAGARLALLRPATVATALAAALAGHAAAQAHLSDAPAGLPPAGLSSSGLSLSGVSLLGPPLAGSPLTGLLWVLAAAMALGLGGAMSHAAAGRGTPALRGALLLAGVTAAVQVSPAAAALAALAGAVLAALRFGGDRHRWLGPLLSGAAFGLLFLLGAAQDPAALSAAAPAVLAPACYGAAFGIVRNVAHWRGDRRPAQLALGLLLAALLLPVGLGWFDDYAGLSALPFALVLAWWVLPDFLWGAGDPRPVPVRAALVAGRLSAPALPAALAAGFGGLVIGLFLLLLVPLAGLLERGWGDR